MGLIWACITAAAFHVVCLIGMSPLTPYTLRVLAGRPARFPLSVSQNRATKGGQTWKWCTEAESFFTVNDWWNNEFKLSKMENWFRGDDYDSQWRLKLSKWLGVNALSVLMQVCVIHGDTLVVQKVSPRPQQQPQQGIKKLHWHGAHEASEEANYSSLLSQQNPARTVTFYQWTRVLEQKGTCEWWLVTCQNGWKSWQIYQLRPKFIRIWLVAISYPEEEMKAGWLPWHCLDPDGVRQKGMQVLYQQPMFHKALKGSSTNNSNHM